MSSKKSEISEIEVLSEDQIQRLPANAKEDIIFLSKNMNANNLVTLNPLVTTILDIRSRILESKTIVENEDGNFSKEEIDEYKAIKSDLRSFNGDLGRASKKMKAEHKKVIDGVTSVSKTFKAISDELKNKIEEIQKPFELRKSEKKAEADKKKNAALNAEIQKNKDAAELLAIQNKKTALYNDIKYTETSEKITSHVAVSLTSLNKSSLESLKLNISNKTWETITAGKEINLLAEDLIEELKTNFEQSKKNAVALIEDKLSSIKVQEENAILESKNKDIISSHVLYPKSEGFVNKIEPAAQIIEDNFPSEPPLPPGHATRIEQRDNDGNEITDEEFYKVIKEKAETLLRVVNDRIAVNPTLPPYIYDLKDALDNIKKL